MIEKQNPTNSNKRDQICRTAAYAYVVMFMLKLSALILQAMNLQAINIRLNKEFGV